MQRGSTKYEKGCILVPSIIFKSTNKNKILHPFKNKSFIAHNKRAWNTSELYLSYLTAIISNFKILENEHIVLLHDQFSGHNNEYINSWAQQNKITIWNIETGSTYLTQLIDTHIGKPFKDRIKKYQAEWLED
ncbi:hypothetical protein ABPG72_012118 [Tetrahymena utriculariae]